MFTQSELIVRIEAVIYQPQEEHTMKTTNPLIGMTDRETVENVAEALSAALVLMADKHSGLCRLLTPVLNDLEGDNASKRETIESAADAFSAAIVLMADKHSDLCRLLMPVLNALEYVAIVAEQKATGAKRTQAATGRKTRGAIRSGLAGVNVNNRASVVHAIRA